MRQKSYPRDEAAQSRLLGQLKLQGVVGMGVHGAMWKSRISVQFHSTLIPGLVSVLLFSLKLFLR